MLGNPLYDGGVFFQQFFIPLLGGVLYAGKEEPLIDMEAFDDFSSYICRNTGFCPRFLKNLPASLPTVQPALCSPRKKARCPFIQAVERCDEIPLEKELESDVLPFVVENRRRQPFRIKNNLSAILPSSSNIVLGGTDNSVISGSDRK